MVGREEKPEKTHGVGKVGVSEHLEPLVKVSRLGRSSRARTDRDSDGNQHDLRDVVGEEKSQKRRERKHEERARTNRDDHTGQPSPTDPPNLLERAHGGEGVRRNGGDDDEYGGAGTVEGDRVESSRDTNEGGTNDEDHELGVEGRVRFDSGKGKERRKRTRR